MGYYLDDGISGTGIAKRDEFERMGGSYHLREGSAERKVGRLHQDAESPGRRTISDFDGSLWGSMVEFVTVSRDKEITVTFWDGSEIQA